MKRNYISSFIPLMGTGFEQNEYLLFITDYSDYLYITKLDSKGRIRNCKVSR